MARELGETRPRERLSGPGVSDKRLKVVLDQLGQESKRPLEVWDPAQEDSIQQGKQLAGPHPPAGIRLPQLALALPPQTSPSLKQSPRAPT